MDTLKKEICNARIVDTQLGIEDHGLLTFNLRCEFRDSYGKGTCSFGGCSFGSRCMNYDGTYEYVNVKFTSELLMRVLTVVGVRNWEDIKGKLIRIRTNGRPGCAGGIEAIGNIIEDEWFCIEDFYEEKEKED